MQTWNWASCLWKSYPNPLSFLVYPPFTSHKSSPVSTLSPLITKYLSHSHHHQIVNTQVRGRRRSRSRKKRVECMCQLGEKVTPDVLPSLEETQMKWKCVMKEIIRTDLRDELRVSSTSTRVLQSNGLFAFQIWTKQVNLFQSCVHRKRKGDRAERTRWCVPWNPSS